LYLTENIQMIFKVLRKAEKLKNNSKNTASQGWTALSESFYNLVKSVVPSESP